MSQLTVELSQDTQSRLAAFAAARGISINDSINDALDLLLNSEHDLYRSVGEPNQDSLDAMEEARNYQNMQRYTFEEFKALCAEIKKSALAESTDLQNS